MFSVRNILHIKTMSPVVTSIHYDATCRTCGTAHNYRLDHETEDFEELEVLVHTDLEDRGWIDGECDRCVVREKSPDLAYDEVAEAALCENDG